MGTVNYFTSDYITLGLIPYDTDDFTSDPGFMEVLQSEVDEYGGNLEDRIYDYISMYYEDDLENIEFELNKYSFQFYHVAIRPGYYKGFTLDIESNFPICFDSWEDKKEAQKEITELKKFLIDCAGYGLVECSPGWCTGYSDYKSTIAAIKKAIQGMREEVKQTPTYRQYMKEVNA